MAVAAGDAAEPRPETPVGSDPPTPYLFSGREERLKGLKENLTDIDTGSYAVPDPAPGVRWNGSDASPQRLDGDGAAAPPPDAPEEEEPLPECPGTPYGMFGRRVDLKGAAAEAFQKPRDHAGPDTWTPRRTSILDDEGEGEVVEMRLANRLETRAFHDGVDRFKTDAPAQTLTVGPALRRVDHPLRGPLKAALLACGGGRLEGTFAPRERPQPDEQAIAAMASKASAPVTLHVYAVGHASNLAHLEPSAQALLGEAGLLHAGLEVLGDEWSFGPRAGRRTGVYAGRPRRAPGHTYRQSVYLGDCKRSEAEARAAADELGVGPLPPWVGRFARAAALLDADAAAAVASLHGADEAAASRSRPPRGLRARLPPRPEAARSPSLNGSGLSFTPRLPEAGEPDSPDVFGKDAPKISPSGPPRRVTSKKGSMLFQKLAADSDSDSEPVSPSAMPTPPSPQAWLPDPVPKAAAAA
ncbi:Lys63-specific deubiquitinase [Aureococcus anophagefferens]|nr:Lys63-specific deubiquitinase [Aureococcus anophagefferens]